MVVTAIPSGDDSSVFGSTLLCAWPCAPCSLDSDATGCANEQKAEAELQPGITNDNQMDLFWFFVFEAEYDDSTITHTQTHARTHTRTHKNKEIISAEGLARSPL